MSVLAEETVAVAAASGLHARPGRDLRWTVIAWYVEGGRPAGRKALVWAIGRSHVQRLMAQARTAGGGSEEAQDAFYAEAGRLAGRGPAGLPHPDEMRRLVVEDPGGMWEPGPERSQAENSTSNTGPAVGRREPRRRSPRQRHTPGHPPAPAGRAVA